MFKTLIYMRRVMRKPDFFHKVQISCAITIKLSSVIVFATQIILFPNFLNPKFQASNTNPVPKVAELKQRRFVPKHLNHDNRLVNRPEDVSSIVAGISLISNWLSLGWDHDFLSTLSNSFYVRPFY